MEKITDFISLGSPIELISSLAAAVIAFVAIGEGFADLVLIAQVEQGVVSVRFLDNARGALIRLR
jgi:hypothetical protein